MNITRQDQSLPLPNGTLVPILLCVVLWAVLVWYSIANCHGPQPVSGGPLSSSQASADRAMETVRMMSGGGVPHPAGSEDNDRVHRELVAMIEAMGLQPNTQHTTHRRWRQETTEEFPIKNIWFRINADEPVADPMLLMLVSHHDSTPYGPGAGDAASGVAALMETARLLIEVTGRHHDVLFLITDGEEYGLLGADKFVKEHPLAGEVDLCINLEARGTSGPSLMFQLGPNGSDLLRLYSKNVSRPFTGSLFDTVYRRLPNDTDFTIFSRAGIRGFNFAFIGNVENYHTTYDDADHLDLRSLQHHCNNVWELTRAISLTPGRMEGGQEAVWFDVLGQFVVWWPVAWNWPMCGIAFVSLGIGYFRNRLKPDNSRLPVGMLLYCGLVVFATVVVGAIPVSVIEVLLKLDARLQTPWPHEATSILLLTGLASSGLALMALAGSQLQYRQEVQQAWSAWKLVTGFFWCALASLAAYAVPGASYLFMVPLVAAAVLIHLPPGKTFRIMAGVLPVLLMGIVWIWLAPSLYSALGFQVRFMWPAILTCLLTGAIPAMYQASRWQLMVVAVVAAAVAVVALAGAIVAQPVF